MGRQLLSVPFRAATYLRAVHILVGGVFLLPYVLLVLLFTELSAGTAAENIPMLVVLITLAAGIGVGIALLPATRSVEIVMARTLLGVDLPDPEPDTTRAWSVRLRTAAWYALGLLVGGLGSAVMVVTLSVAVPLLLPPYRDDAPAAAVQHTLFGPGSPLDGPLAGPPLAVVALLLTAYLLAGLGEVQARIAPTALGPGPEEALVTARRESRRLAAQAHLAQELHDTLGHALTAACRQAEAGARVLDDDPATARAALDAVAEVSRRALDDLDRVMGLLRGGTPDGDREAARDAPGGDLQTLPALLDAVRAGGYDVTTDTGELTMADLPPLVSRTAHGIVREALTNAMRHGDPGSIALSLRTPASGRELVVEVRNPAGHPPATRHRGGRGLAGLAERCALLGGGFDAGPRGRDWCVRAVLPLDTAGDRT